MAIAAALSYSSVQRIWRAHVPTLHLIKTFKVSRDKNFATKVEDVVGLYLNPPDKALVLCIDERAKSRRSTAKSTKMPAQSPSSRPGLPAKSLKRSPERNKC